MFFNDSFNNEDLTSAFSCFRCVRRYSNDDQLHQHLLKNHKVDSRASSYIKLIHHISVYSFTTREYIKIIARTFDRKRRDICLNNDSMMFLIDSKLIKDMNLTSHVMKNVNLIDVNNKTTNFYVNYIIKVDDENVFIQAYVVNDLVVEILLNVDVIEDYSMNILTSERMIVVSNSKISMTFEKVEDIVINHIIIASVSSSTTSKTESVKFKIVTIHFSSTFRIKASVNEISRTPQNDDKKQSVIQFSKEFYKCQRCFRIFCSDNELHRHIASTHTELRRRRSSKRNHRFRDFVDL